MQAFSNLKCKQKTNDESSAASAILNATPTNTTTGNDVFIGCGTENNSDPGNKEHRRQLI